MAFFPTLGSTMLTASVLGKRFFSGESDQLRRKPAKTWVLKMGSRNLSDALEPLRG